MEKNLNVSGKHLIWVQIDNVVYEIDAFFSLGDCEKAMKIENDEAPDYRKLLGFIIEEHIQCNEEARPSIESIIDSEAISLYVDAILSDSTEIREKYESHPEIVDKAEKFITAANDNTKEETEKFNEALKEIKFPKIELQQVSPLNLLKNEMVKNSFDYSSILPVTEEISEIIKNITKPLLDIVAVTKTYQDGIRAIIEAQQSFLKDIADQMAKAISKIPSFSISEDRIREIREAQRIWGSYGWTIPKHAEIRDVFNAPVNKTEADKTAMKYCKSNHMEVLFNETKKFDGIRVHDYEEAIADYKDRRYKSCALLLFSLIDAGLIKMQRDEDRNRGRRPTGKTAAKNVLEHYKGEQLMEDMYISIFKYENLYACLMKVFEDGKDFKKQPDIINRNFLNHGMLTARVRKRDCIQLFLLYYNWLSFLEGVE